MEMVPTSAIQFRYCNSVLVGNRTVLKRTYFVSLVKPASFFEIRWSHAAFRPFVRR
jgi:hypothetical protein